ncbi:MAG: M56 family metallopeptidase [Candidatus Binataceae bacterium]
MDRELVLAILIALLCGVALMASGSWWTGAADTGKDSACEQRAWLRLWLPFLPAMLMLAALGGWALREPASAERVPNRLLWCALPFAAIFARAAWRALRSLRIRDEGLAAATVGLLRPRIVVSPRMAAALDHDALAAALEHEKAHALHHDPLRLWLAHLGTDLLWPWPAAHSRLVFWKRDLEFARDDEARLHGASGPDLAAAILVSIRMTQAHAPCGAATLGADEAFVKQRVERLLQPLIPPASQPNPAVSWLLPALTAISLAMMGGAAFGERAVRALFGLG